MRKIAYFGFALMVISCVKNHEKMPVEKSITEAKKLSIDSLILDDSVKINNLLSAKYNEKILVFSNLENKVLLDSIYAPVDINLKIYDKSNVEKAISLKQKNYFDESKEGSKDWTPSFEQTWDESVRMNVFSQKNDLLTLLYNYSGYSGGAHGYYNEIYKVFNLKQNKTIQLSDIIKNPNDDSWSPIMLNNFDEKEQKDMLLVDKVLPSHNFYFDENKIVFVYNQYDITAYAAGVVYITLKFKNIKDRLNPEFVKTYQIK